jgi:hypothetical protein
MKGANLRSQESSPGGQRAPRWPTPIIKEGEMIGDEPEFMHNTDEVSLARACRLAYVQSAVRQKLIEFADGIELLKGCLEPDNESTRYDDSRFLR